MIRQVLTVFRGTAVAQIVGFLILPILSRLYGSENFGHFQLYQSVMTVALIVAAGRYEIAILRARTDSQASAVCQLALAVTVGVGCLATVLAGIVLAFVPLEPGARLVTMFLPVAVVIGGWYQTAGYVTARKQAFHLVSNARIAQAAGQSGSAWALGVAGLLTQGLIAADIAGRALGFAVLCAFRCRLGFFDRVVSLRRLVGTALRFREYPLISMPAGLVNSAGIVLTPLLIYAYFDPVVAGQFALVDRAMNFPIGLIAISISQVFMSNISRASREGESIHKLFRRVLVTTVLLSIPPMIMVVLAGPWLFQLVFGTGWMIAGQFAQLLAPTIMASFVQGSLTMALVVTGHQKAQAAWDVGRLLLMVGIWLTIITLHLPVRTAIALHSAAVCATALLFVGMVHHFLKRADRTLSVADAAAAAARQNRG